MTRVSLLALALLHLLLWSPAVGAASDPPDEVRQRVREASPPLRDLAELRRRIVWADATIDGDSVVVSSEQVAKPAAVRYAWASRSPWANLFNKDGLPALTFRTEK